MASGPPHPEVQPPPAVPGTIDDTDGQLLVRFSDRHDGAAFAELVRRHGPMVWGVCRRILNDSHDAEDAFQATFLVLVRKANAIGRPELLANWLYGVAYRTAVHARSAAARRHAHHRELTDMSTPEPPPEVAWQELRPLLDEELNRLPDRYRAPLVLCYLEGKSTDEAAQVIGCPRGTVMSRLARGRERLRRRLSARGVTLSAGAFAVVLTQHGVSAAAPPALVGTTVLASVLFAAGKTAGAGVITASVLGLVQGVTKAVTLVHCLHVLLRWLLASCLLVAVVGGGGLLVYLSGVAVLRDGPAGRTEHEITQLDAALQAFKSKYGFYPPSRIRLRERLGEYYPYNGGDPDQLDVDSVYYLSKMFPKIVDTWNGTPVGAPTAGVLPGMDWNLNGRIDNDSVIELEGDQCLVFFLGGMQFIDPENDTPRCVGFSKDVANPIKVDVQIDQAGKAQRRVIGDRIKFFDFDPQRLVYRHRHKKPIHPDNPPAKPRGVTPRTPFFSYADRWSETDGKGTLNEGMPYAYFSSYKKENGYNRYFAYYREHAKEDVSDCQTLGVWPYARSSQRDLGFPNLVYLHPNTYQIISAGRDAIFGSGTTPTAARAGKFYVPDRGPAYPDLPGKHAEAGHDDLSDFHKGRLGEQP